jgi:hypothetical protein
MASADLEHLIVLRISQMEAGVLLGVLDFISGPTDQLGRRETDAIRRALASKGVVPYNLWDGEIHARTGD